MGLSILFPPEVPFTASRPFFCPLTIEGHEIWSTDPPDPRLGPLDIFARGPGALPIWFVSTAEPLPAIADLEAMSSLLIGYADRLHTDPADRQRWWRESWATARQRKKGRRQPTPQGRG